jgi:hypothetical protein
MEMEKLITIESMETEYSSSVQRFFLAKAIVI